ncbi:hypothetical protein [Chitinophaga ginsengisoli]|uniref:Uncharacterized protein n=1 Tax=Chitinophaga ginsengisoli TaxID=363837 RepID=A0A2P8G5C0_9BACT|nr:hypothetical protein [Chitinophaga ginsengisoli]PSL29157.1 hypothetical protein CLV42_107304 [Chitinophaga ginsengisoli]
MAMEQETLELELQEIMSALDDKRLSVLVYNLSAAELQQYKTALTEAWYSIYEFWYYERLYGKAKMENGVDAFFTWLLYLLTEAEKINTPVIYYNERSRCYQEWAGVKTKKKEKDVYIEKAIKEISQGLKADPSSCILNSRMIDLFLSKAYLINQATFTDEQLAVLFCHFEKVIAHFSGEEWHSLLGYCFQILEFTAEKNEYWHTVFINRFSAAIQTVTEKELDAYPGWSEQLSQITSFYHATMSPDYQQKIVIQFRAVLKRLYGKT